MNKKWGISLILNRLITAIIVLLQIVVLYFFVIKRNEVSLVFAIFSFCLSLIIIFKIVIDKSEVEYKTLWLILAILFPIFGSYFYVIFNMQLSSKRFFKKVKKAECKMKEYASITKNVFSVNESEDISYNKLLKFEKSLGFNVYSSTSCSYYKLGEIAFENMLKELENAKNYIFLEYFIIREGKMWDAILSVLKKKARSGVIVRIIYDDFGCFLSLPKDYFKTLKNYDIEAVKFNPFKPILSGVINNRDHRKICVIDGVVAFVGGINLADEYINAVEKFGHWKDNACKLYGKSAWGFTLMFLQMWEIITGSSEDYSLYFPKEDDNFLVENDGLFLPYMDCPKDDINVSESMYLQVINKAKNYLYITTPYLILNSTLLKALKLASVSGVNVKIITPFKYDKKLVHIVTRSYYRELISAGVEIYEYKKGFIHSKMIISDGNVATIGSTNLDFRSLFLHFECGVVIYKNTEIKNMVDDFLETIEVSEKIQPESLSCNIFKRFIQNFLRIFAPFM